MSDNEDSSHSEQTEDSDSDSFESSGAELSLCLHLKLQEHIRADVEDRALLRDEHSVPCESKLAEKVVTNYIIAKRILSNVCWQDKVLCKKVCTTWLSAVNALAKENLNPVDYVYNIYRRPDEGNFGEFVKSDEFHNEPLAVLSFINACGVCAALKCKDIFPCPCKKQCETTRHSILDAIQHQVCAPKVCMLSVVASALTYLPLANSPTEQCSPDNPNIPTAFFSGITIPVIPGVQFHVLDIQQTKKNTNTMDLKRDFYAEVDRITNDQIIKGGLVFVTDKYILQSVQDIMMLNYLKEAQPDQPYALGGCLIEEIMFEKKDLDTLIDSINMEEDLITKTLISIALFTVPKTVEDAEHREKFNFEMYSVVILRSEWVKEKIKNVIDEFARGIPRFEHSLAVKLSCVGRDKKHMLEQELFRNAFPNTPLIGCYGNGELGLNHPPRAPPEPLPSRLKRHKGEPERTGLMYSYSTVFVYMGWGRIVSAEAGSPKK